MIFNESSCQYKIGGILKKKQGVKNISYSGSRQISVLTLNVKKFLPCYDIKE